MKKNFGILILLFIVFLITITTIKAKTISDLKISNEVINNIDYFINAYYDRYTGLYLKSKKFLKDINKLYL